MLPIRLCLSVEMGRKFAFREAVRVAGVSFLSCTKVTFRFFDIYVNLFVFEICSVSVPVKIHFCLWKLSRLFGEIITFVEPSFEDAKTSSGLWAVVFWNSLFL